MKGRNLTKREHELATVYATGASHREIAGQFSIAPATVRAHIYSVYRKLKVSNKSELLLALTGVDGLQGREGTATDKYPRLAVVFLRDAKWSAAEQGFTFAFSLELSRALSGYPDVLQASSKLAPFAYESDNVKVIAERCDARYLLLIAADMAEEHLSLRLLDALSEVLIWGHVEDIRSSAACGWLASLAKQVCSKLASIHGEIVRAETRRISAVNPESMDAHELYLGSLHGLETDGRAASILGAQMAERCTQLAPHFGRGWLALNWRRQNLLVHGWIAPSPGWLIKEEDIFRRAVEADPNDGLTLGYLALSLAKQRRIAEALRALDRAEELLGKNVDATVEVSIGLSTVSGKPFKALQLIERARMLDPTPHSNWAFMEARAAFFSGDDERALSALLDAPDCVPKLVVEILSAAELGERERARHAWARLLKRVPSFDFELYAKQLPITEVVASARYEHAVKRMRSFWIADD